MRINSSNYICGLLLTKKQNMVLLLRLLFTFFLSLYVTPSIAAVKQVQKQWCQQEYKTLSQHVRSNKEQQSIADVEDIEKIGLAELEFDYHTVFKGCLSIDYNYFLPLVLSPLDGAVSSELFYFEKKRLKQNRAKYLVFQTLKIPLC